MSEINITALAVTRKLRNGRENTGTPTTSLGGSVLSDANVYSHTGTTVRTVGGISSGTDLNGLTYQQIFDLLFY